jgi:hypothetical protein
MIFLLITTSIKNQYIHIESRNDLKNEALVLMQNEINARSLKKVNSRDSILQFSSNRPRPKMRLVLSESLSKEKNLNLLPNKEELEIQLKEKISDVESQNRIDEYKENIKNTLLLNKENFIPIIIENNGTRKTFLDDFGIAVHYTNNNNEKFKHKGVNELLDIKSAIEKYNIGDDDMIIKLTGRYRILNDSFFEFVKQNENNYDVFMKFYNVCEETFMDNDCIMGMFSIRCKYLKQFEYNLDLEIPEREFAEYVRNLQCRICEMEDLNLRCKFSDNYRTLDV